MWDDVSLDRVGVGVEVIFWIYFEVRAQWFHERISYGAQDKEESKKSWERFLIWSIEIGIVLYSKGEGYGIVWFTEQPALAF